MSEKLEYEERSTIEHCCSRGYWIKCFLNKDEAKENISSPNQYLYHWIDKQAHNDALEMCEKLASQIECNESFHRLGGIDDCEPCKALREYESFKESLK